MLNGLESGLQRRFERHGPYEMFQELKLIFQANNQVERYEVSNKLNQVGVYLPDKIVIDRIL